MNTESNENCARLDDAEIRLSGVGKDRCGQKQFTSRYDQPEVHVEFYVRSTDQSRSTPLAKIAPANVCEQGTNNDQRCHRESSQKTGPKTDSAKWNEQGSFMPGQGEPVLLRKQGAHSNCQKKARSPDNRDSEC
jgi:hypothetical protein